MDAFRYVLESRGVFNKRWVSTRGITDFLRITFQNPRALMPLRSDKRLFARVGREGGGEGFRVQNDGIASIHKLESLAS